MLECLRIDTGCYPCLQAGCVVCSLYGITRNVFQELLELVSQLFLFGLERLYLPPQLCQLVKKWEFPRGILVCEKAILPPTGKK